MTVVAPAVSGMQAGLQAHDFAVMRRAMVNSQLRVSDVNDPALLAAFNAVAREDHVPAAMQQVAYLDRAIPLGPQAVLNPPLSHGQMLAAAAPRFGQRALLVSDNGYLAALLGKLGVTVEQMAPAQAAALKNKPGAGDYHLLLIDGAIEELPVALGNQLGIGGRVVTGWLQRGISRLATGIRQDDQPITLAALGEADFAVLPAFAAPRRWSF